jgi:hypothetical protein
MLCTLSYQMYKYEHGLSAAEQRAEDVRAGEGAAALRDLGSCLRRALHVRRRPGAVPPAELPGHGVTTAAS